jgi:hypothetical protein
VKAAIVPVALLWLSLAAAQEPAPVPAAWLHDGKLEVSDLNFSIQTPPGQWNWTYQKGQRATTFIATDDDGARYVVGVLERPSRALSPQNKDDFLRGMSKTLPAGWTIADSQFADSAIPLPKSMKFTIRLLLPDQSVGYQHGYGAPGKRTYMFSAFTRDSMEPPSFAAFASSFHIINAEANAYSPFSALAGGQMMIAGYGILMLVVAGICALINQANGRPVVNPFAVAAWAIVIAAVAHFGFVIKQLAQGNIDDPYHQGEAVGRVVGAAIIPLIIAFILSRRTRPAVTSPPR